MRESMEIYPRTAVERTMKLHEVLLRASAGKIKWWQAAELMGISPRQLRRWRKRLAEQGHNGLLDRRRQKPSLYRDKHFDLNVRHSREKLVEDHQIGLSYTWVKQALQAAGLVRRGAKRGVHRKRRERRPLPGIRTNFRPNSVLRVSVRPSARKLPDFGRSISKTGQDLSRDCASRQPR
jgi:Helix-turn-helix domain